MKFVLSGTIDDLRRLIADHGGHHYRTVVAGELTRIAFRSESELVRWLTLSPIWCSGFNLEYSTPHDLYRITHAEWPEDLKDAEEERPWEILVIATVSRDRS